jgi:hypothetical protein
MENQGGRAGAVYAAKRAVGRLCPSLRLLAGATAGPGEGHAPVFTLRPGPTGQRFPLRRFLDFLGEALREATLL